MLKWCLDEAKANELKPEDYMGGFVIDEMKVQVIAIKIKKITVITYLIIEN